MDTNTEAVKRPGGDHRHLRSRRAGRRWPDLSWKLWRAFRSARLVHAVPDVLGNRWTSGPGGHVHDAEVGLLSLCRPVCVEPAGDAHDRAVVDPVGPRAIDRDHRGLTPSGRDAVGANPGWRLTRRCTE